MSNVKELTSDSWHSIKAFGLNNMGLLSSATGSLPPKQKHSVIHSVKIEHQLCAPHCYRCKNSAMTRKDKNLCPHGAHVATENKFQTIIEVILLNYPTKSFVYLYLCVKIYKQNITYKALFSLKYPYCYGLNRVLPSPQTLYVEANPQCDCAGDRTFKEIMKVKCGHICGTLTW